MLKKALTLAIKDIKLGYRDRGAVIGSYLAPIIILIIFGVIYEGMIGGGDDINIDILFADQENSEQSEKFIENLSNEDVFTVQITDPDSEDEIPLTEARAKEMILAGDARLALVYHRTEPLEDFPVFDRPVMTLYYDPSSDMERQITSGLIQRIAFMNIGTELPRESVGFMLDEIGVRETPVGVTILNFMDEWMSEIEYLSSDESDESESSDMGTMMEGLIDLETEEIIREEVKRGNPFMANTVSGVIVMFLLFSVSYAAAALLKEQQEGTIKRLLLAPITVDAIVFGKFLSIGFNSLCQLTVMLILATVLFKVNILGNIGPVIIMSIATVAAVTAFGMIVAAIAKSYDQINAMITVIVLTMSGIGGSMFPRILMPDWMKNLGLITINGWAIDGYLDALYRYNDAGSILGYGEAHSFIDFIHNSEALVLILFALICGWIAGRLFKKRLVQGG